MINIKTFKERQQVYTLVPDYPIGLSGVEGEYADIKYLNEKIIYKVMTAIYKGFEDKQYEMSRDHHILIEGFQSLQVVVGEKIFPSLGEANKACERHNKRAFSILGERVTKIEAQFKKMEAWAKQLNYK